MRGLDFQGLTDNELMLLVQQEDFAAFDEIYHRYHQRIRRFLMSLIWDDERADDYLQEVFIRLWRSRDRYQQTGKFSNFLFQIAKNHYLSERRKMLKRGELFELSEDRLRDASIWNIRISDRIDPEASLLEKYRLFKIRQAIDLLPEGQKLVFVMAHLEGMDYSQISQVLNVPVGTVKSRMWSAVRKLKGLLREIQP